MNTFKRVSLVLAFVLVTFTFAQAADFSIGVGTGNYYVNVGDYDYLPYAYQYDPGFRPPTVNFYDMMRDYGTWVSVNPFGQVWQPYVASGWRPYTYGHWNYNSQYGPMWSGYEPWAWAGYHYGNWIFSQQYGWVWIPGYDWHPGRVAWSSSYDSLGWMPLPPTGYDYSRGYLAYNSGFNQFGCNDSDFGIGISIGGIGLSYGGPYYDPRCRNLYYNQGYMGMVPNLWTFINGSDFGYDNYADYYLGPDYARYVFDRRLVRITSQPLSRPVLEQITRVRIEETPVVVKQLSTDKQTIRVVVPSSEKEVERVRRYSTEVVKEVIAPAFVEKQKPFKAESSKTKDVVAKVFRQENAQPKIETLSSAQVKSMADQARQQKQDRRVKKAEVAKEKVVRLEKEGKIKEPKGKATSQEMRQQNRPDTTRETPAPETVDKEPGRRVPSEQRTERSGKDRERKTNVPGEPTGNDQERSRAERGNTTRDTDTTIAPGRGRAKRMPAPEEPTTVEPGRGRAKRTPDMEEPANRNRGVSEPDVEQRGERGTRETTTEATPQRGNEEVVKPETKDSNKEVDQKKESTQKTESQKAKKKSKDKEKNQEEEPNR